MGLGMRVSSWVEVVWHAGRWHQLGAAAHLAAAPMPPTPTAENRQLSIVGK